MVEKESRNNQDQKENMECRLCSDLNYNKSEHSNTPNRRSRKDRRINEAKEK
jgi:hypothetical protein